MALAKQKKSAGRVALEGIGAGVVGVAFAGMFAASVLDQPDKTLRGIWNNTGTSAEAGLPTTIGATCIVDGSGAVQIRDKYNQTQLTVEGATNDSRGIHKGTALLADGSHIAVEYAVRRGACDFKRFSVKRTYKLAQS